MTDNFLDDVEITSPAPGIVTLTHAAHVCAGSPCCIHNPSDHHMNTWRMVFRSDRAVRVNGRVFVLTERICEHGRGHPDPDAIAFAREIGGDEFADTQGVHGCCGCCVRAAGIEPARPESPDFESGASA